MCVYIYIYITYIHMHTYIYIYIYPPRRIVRLRKGRCAMGWDDEPKCFNSSFASLSSF